MSIPSDLDESNGNGIFAMKSTGTGTSSPANSNNGSPSATMISPPQNTSSSLNSIMTATTNAANAAIASGSAVAAAVSSQQQQLQTSISSEDLSQSLSEYTDADESISAPTEFLAEFLSAVMLKDYKKALKYCKLILQYEPNNATAKEFYPLILDKLRELNNSDSDENYNKSSSPEPGLDLPSHPIFAHDNDGAGSYDQYANDEPNDADEADDPAEDFGVNEENSSGEPNSNDSHSCDSVGLSLSDSVEDDEVDILSSSGDDLPIDDQMRSISDDADNDEDMEKELGASLANKGSSFKIRNGSSSGGENRSGSDNTTHSFSSLLLEEEEEEDAEEEDDLAPTSLQFQKPLTAHELDISNGNKIPSASCSDSESPTEPLTQRLAAILRSKCSISSGD